MFTIKPHPHLSLQPRNANPLDIYTQTICKNVATGTILRDKTDDVHKNFRPFNKIFTTQTDYTDTMVFEHIQALKEMLRTSKR